MRMVSRADKEMILHGMKSIAQTVDNLDDELKAAVGTELNSILMHLHYDSYDCKVNRF